MKISARADEAHAAAAKTAGVNRTVFYEAAMIERGKALAKDPKVVARARQLAEERKARPQPRPRKSDDA